MTTAESFLKSKPPYVGDSSFADKPIIKEAGGAWDAGSKKWVAKTKPDFVSLVETGRWFPVGLPPHLFKQACDLIRKSERAALDRELKSRTSSKAPVVTEAEEERIRRERNDISADTPEQLAKLAELGISSAMIRPAMAHSGLGPYSGQSDAFRLLRGLRYNIITTEQVVSGDFATENRAEVDAKRRARAARTEKAQQQQLLKSLLSEGEAAGSSSQAHVPTERKQPWMDPKYKNPPARYADTYCDDCKDLVTDQFLECLCAMKCVETGATLLWEQCGKCGYKRRMQNGACVQPCHCDRSRASLLSGSAPPPPKPVARKSSGMVNFGNIKLKRPRDS